MLDSAAMNRATRARVLFVCLGNICRSPTAQAVFQSMVDAHGLTDVIEVDSCGTIDSHVGQAPDRRAQAKAARRGYDLSALRARQFQDADYARFDYILAMDNRNLAELHAMRPSTYPGHLGLFLEFTGVSDPMEVPDPYYGGSRGFNHVLDLVEWASEGLLREIRHARLQAPS